MFGPFFPATSGHMPLPVVSHGQFACAGGYRAKFESFGQQSPWMYPGSHDELFDGHTARTGLLTKDLAWLISGAVWITLVQYVNVERVTTVYEGREVYCSGVQLSNNINALELL